MAVKLRLIIGFLAIIVITAAENPCRPEQFDYDSFVCVCDEQYCDSLDPELPSDGEYLLVTTDKDSLRFSTSYGTVDQPDQYDNFQCRNLLNKSSAIFNIERNSTAQTILGYGGSFTDAVGINLDKLTPELVDVFYNTLFTKEGLNYNMARTTIGHCDFSPYEYYYTSVEDDLNMTSWALGKEDQWRIPYIKKAMSMVDDFKLTANIWTVPAWLREDNDSGVKAKIIEKYWDSYCLYIMKYLEAFREEGIEFWSVGYVNEPTVIVGSVLFANQEQMLTTWAANKLAKFAVEHFSPALKQHGFNNTKIMFFDDLRTILSPGLVITFLDQEGFSDIVELVGLHSYYNYLISTSLVDDFYEELPNVTILTTELSSGQNEGVRLGAWANAEFYATNYIEEMNHYSSAWIDWNLALDTAGQPQYLGYSVDASIIIDHDRNVFYKQPSYYAIGHFSKFIPKGSQKINITTEFDTDIQTTAALRPDGLIAACLLNSSNLTVEVTIKDIQGDITVDVLPNSINTVVF